MLSQKSVRFSKRVAAVAATVALAFTGLVAGVAAPAQAADNLPMDIRVTRNLDNAQVSTIQPGESINVNISVTIDARSNGSTIVSDLAVDDILTFQTNLTSSLTPSYSQYSWYITGVTNSCYGITFPNANQLTWTQAMKDCGGGAGAGYISVYLQASLNNNTSSPVTLSADPKLITPSAPSGLASTEPGLYDSITVTMFGYDVTSYTAIEEDSSIYIDSSSAICVSRDLAAGDAFEALFAIKEDGVELANTDDGTNPYANNTIFPRYLPAGATTSELLRGSAELVGYEASSGTLTLTTAAPHKFNSSSVDIVGTGIAELDAIDENYAYVQTETTFIIYGMDVADTAYTSLSEGTVTAERGGDFYLVPASNQGIKVTANSNVNRPAAGSVYTLSGSVVNNADGVTSVERQCGPGVPTFTIDTAGSSSSIIAVDIDQVSGADYYQCRAYNSANVMVYQGHLNETSRAAGTPCQIYSLSSSTAYTVKVLAGNNFEGEGAESAGLSHTTSAGGGGGWVPPAMVTPTLGAPAGASTIAVTTPAEKTMNSAITVTDTSRSFAGANGDMFYASVVAGTATIVHNTASGADTKFAGTGKLVITDVMSINSVTWTGLKGAGFSVIYRKASNGSYVAKWGLMTTASGMKTQEITTAKLAAFCTTNAGSGYNLGGLLPTSSVMTTPFVRVSCVSNSDPNLAERVILANVAASSTAPLVKTSAQPTKYVTSSYPCTSISLSSNKAGTSTTAAMLVIATTHAKYSSGGGPAYCMQGQGTVLKREVISISGAGKKLVSSLPTSSVIGTDIGIFSAAPGKSVNTWVVLAGTNGGMMSAPATKYILTVDAKAKVVKGKNITYSSASAASNLKFSNYSTLGAAAQLSTGTILAVRQGNVTGSNNQSWAAVSINLSTGVVTTGKVITVTATEYTGTQQFSRNMNMTSFTSDSKKLNVYVLSNPTTKKYKVATWTMPTR